MAKTHYNLMVQSYLILWEMIFKNGLNYSEFKAKLKTWYGEECLCIIVHIVGLYAFENVIVFFM